MLHSWEVLANILSSDKTTDIVCDIGMYVPSTPSSVGQNLSYGAQARDA